MNIHWGKNASWNLAVGRTFHGWDYLLITIFRAFSIAEGKNFEQYATTSGQKHLLWRFYCPRYCEYNSKIVLKHSQCKLSPKTGVAFIYIITPLHLFCWDDVRTIFSFKCRFESKHRIKRFVVRTMLHQQEPIKFDGLLPIANTNTVFLCVAVSRLRFKILFRLSEKNSHHNRQNLVTTLLLETYS